MILLHEKIGLRNWKSANVEIQERFWKIIEGEKEIILQ